MEEGTATGATSLFAKSHSIQEERATSAAPQLLAIRKGG